MLGHEWHNACLSTWALIALGGENEIDENPGARDRPPGLKRRIPSSIQFDLDCRERLRLSRLQPERERIRPCRPVRTMPLVKADFRWAPGRRTWTSSDDEDIELDLYVNYAGKINDTFAWTAGVTYYDYPLGTDLGRISRKSTSASTPATSASSSGMPDDFFDARRRRAHTPKPTTRSRSATSFSLAFHAGYAWGEPGTPSSDELIDYAVQGNYGRQLHDLRASSPAPMPAMT